MSTHAAPNASMGPSPAGHERRDLRCYNVYGGVLRSELEFPELPAAITVKKVDWTLTLACEQRPDADRVLVGERRLGQEVYRLWRSDGAFELDYSHAGFCRISTDGSKLVFYLKEPATVELVRAIVLGPVLAIALELAGVFCLHGSAVGIDRGALAFIGPKHHGKSTLAAVLTTLGADLLADDLVAVAPGPPAEVRPGVPSVRLWNDSVHALSIHRICRTVVPGIKTTATGFAESPYTGATCRLEAIYLLSPLPGGSDTPPVSRVRVSPQAAAVAVAQQTKLPDSLIGLQAAGLQLRAACNLAVAVPVWVLNTVRDFGAIRQVAEQVLDWYHGDRHVLSNDGVEPGRSAAAPVYLSGVL